MTCGYDDPQASWPVAVRLYVPETWTDDPSACSAPGCPLLVMLQTKPQIALSLLDQARQWGVPQRCVVTDADYGDNPHFLSGLEDRNARYVVAIRCDFQVRPKCRGAPPSQRADQVLVAVASP